ncbi:hypothetical protein FC92_GL001016 [Liquorilactobacillus hordei DSM 19519]|uniref:Uncharacterized protein n=2 Tax=Liquorilactobacillus hordei TaxID=468911 RepID=A0A0R1MIZ8_9LACO|nr:hypothetical protein FC92_GL001016 [Liquorilactobacillus hordei DSM 19519]
MKGGETMKFKNNTVLAKHLGNDKIYMWHVPASMGLRHKVRIGSLIKVDTQYGNKIVKAVGVALVKNSSGKFREVVEFIK